MFVTRMKFVLLAFGLIAGGAVVAAQQAGRPEGKRGSRPVNVRLTGPAAARSGGAEDDAAALTKEMEQLEFGLLQDEVTLLRQQVSDALKNKVQYETSTALQDPRTGEDVRRAYTTAREVYLMKARELAAQRRKLGADAEPPKGGAEPSGKAASGADGGKDHAASPSGSQAAAAAIGSIDIDAVFKRSAKVQRSQEVRRRALDDARLHLAELQRDAEQIASLIPKFVPDSPDRRAGRTSSAI